MYVISSDIFCLKNVLEIFEFTDSKLSVIQTQPSSITEIYSKKLYLSTSQTFFDKIISLFKFLLFFSIIIIYKKLLKGLLQKNLNFVNLKN